MQNEMRYHFSDSEYVGTRSDGTAIHVDESAFADTVQFAIRSEGVDTDNPHFNERYVYWRDYYLNPDEWHPGDDGVQTDAEIEREAAESETEYRRLMEMR